MDQIGIAGRVAAGLGKAAARLGSSYVQYRPTDPAAPLGGAPLDTIDCIFDPSPAMTLVATDLRGATYATMIGDFSNLALGDYLVGNDTWFVSGVEPIRAPTCTRCNQTVSIALPGGPVATGDTAYGGMRSSGDITVASGWPASVLSKSRLIIDAARLPSDVRSSTVEILLPSLAGVVLCNGAVVRTGGGDGYLVSGVELSAAGWRLGAELITT